MVINEDQICGSSCLNVPNGCFRQIKICQRSVVVDAHLNYIHGTHHAGIQGGELCAGSRQFSTPPTWHDKNRLCQCQP